MVWDQIQKVKGCEQDLYVIGSCKCLQLCFHQLIAYTFSAMYHRASWAEEQTTSIPSISAIQYRRSQLVSTI